MTTENKTESVESSTENNVAVKKKAVKPVVKKKRAVKPAAKKKAAKPAAIKKAVKPAAAKKAVAKKVVAKKAVTKKAGAKKAVSKKAVKSKVKKQAVKAVVKKKVAKAAGKKKAAASTSPAVSRVKALQTSVVELKQQVKDLNAELKNTRKMEDERLKLASQRENATEKFLASWDKKANAALEKSLKVKKKKKAKK